VLVMAQDEGCFGRIARASRCWAPAKMRPVVAQQVVREYTYAYSAVAPALGRITSLILPRADTVMMNVFLEHVACEFKQYFIVMQVDGAGWHCSSELRVPENMRLIQQPAYSPELNPVEHIWDHIRENFFVNRLFTSLEMVVGALVDGLSRLAEQYDLVKSMTSFPHLQVIC
jgi:hypothetical protein